MVQKVRLTTLDILRGFFLFVIIVDHVELFPSFFDLFSGRGRLWVSAAEGFFFISGLLVGFIYRKKLAKGFLYVWKKLWQRAGLLYITSVALTLLFTYFAVVSGSSAIKYGLPAAINWPDIVTNTLTLRFSFGWADFLPHYVIFMLWAPLALFLLTKRKWWLLGLGSIALWMVRGQDFTFAWQLLFIAGMITGYHWEILKQRWAAVSAAARARVKRTVLILAISTFVLSYASVYILSELNNAQGQLSPILAALTTTWDAWNTAIWHYFEKWTLEPGRILVFGLWFVSAYIVIEAQQGRMPTMLRRYFILLGKNSLFVYGVHSVVIFMLHLLITTSQGIFLNAFITFIVLAVIFGITWLKTNWRTLSWPPRLAQFTQRTEELAPLKKE